MSYEQYSAPGLCFLIEPCCKTRIFAPEYFSDEHLQMAKEIGRFIENDVNPVMDDIEEKKEGVLIGLLKKAGELGFLAIDVPEKYEGMGMDKAMSMLATEVMVPAGSFAVAVLTHVGIGTLPIVYFGTEEQKRKYLPGLASGALLGCYALTEAGSGSDALGAKAKAVLDPSGKFYTLSGEKMFITNSGFADLCMVFAKVGGDKFTAFIVETKTPGFSTGAEEHKMGILGSSTRSVILEDCKVPVENVLGELGKGHKVAFNILNVGRFKLGAGCVGGAKEVLKVSATYANERVQFKRPISSFGAIREKVAFMAARIYAAESMTYRLAGLMDSAIERIDPSAPGAVEKIIAAIEEYAIEQSIMKVYGSEAGDDIVDEGVQIHGGYGYIREYFVERAYRDSRVNRIFEGTNEINRLLIPGTMLRRMMKGKFPMGDILGRIDEIAGDGSKMPVSGSRVLADECTMVDRAKLGAVFAVNLANTQHMMDLTEHKKGQTQMAMLMAANLIMEIYAADSSLARTVQLLEERGEAAARIPLLLARAVLADSLGKVRSIGEELIVNVSGEKDLEKNLGIFGRFVSVPRWKTHDIKEQIAAHFIARERYVLE
jgi:alkylation response protein AidB-like acyl-CoA dehydrogenase